MEVSREVLDLVFGHDSEGSSVHERARTSKRLFVRSQDHLAVDRPEATGRRMSASEALSAFGIERLIECFDYGSAILATSIDEPASTLKRRRNDLGLSVEFVARSAHLPEATVRDAESGRTRTPIRVLQRIAMVLDLDERLIGFKQNDSSIRDLGVRLKSLQRENVRFTHGVVATLAEAAWVIRTQLRLQRELGKEPPEAIGPDANYGSIDYPVWQHAYYLAQKTRERLQLGDEPIASLRNLCWQLGVPLILASLPERFAGATIESGTGRGILVNTRGINANVWMRRATIAHELGHLLWDPAEALKTIRVDEYKDLDPTQPLDAVERRANAFSIDFLAPGKEVDRLMKSSAHGEGLRAIMETYGISLTASRHHILNSVSGIDYASIGYASPEPSKEWQARESYTDDWFPLVETSQLRRGEFAGVVAHAQAQGLVSIDTAAFYLQTEIETFEIAADSIRQLFPMN